VHEVKITAKFENVRQPKQAAQRARSIPRDPTVSSAARNLALAHHIDRLIERGLIADYTAAARMLRVSQPRLTHLMGLLLLAPEIQTAILLGEMAFGEKDLRVLARIADWNQQLAPVRQRLPVRADHCAS
jgi:hypothetical protein